MRINQEFIEKYSLPSSLEGMYIDIFYERRGGVLVDKETRQIVRVFDPNKIVAFDSPEVPRNTKLKYARLTGNTIAVLSSKGYNPILRVKVRLFSGDDKNPPDVFDKNYGRKKAFSRLISKIHQTIQQ